MELTAISQGKCVGTSTSDAMIEWVLDSTASRSKEVAKIWKQTLYQVFFPHNLGIFSKIDWLLGSTCVAVLDSHQGDSRMVDTFYLWRYPIPTMPVRWYSLHYSCWPLTNLHDPMQIIAYNPFLMTWLWHLYQRDTLGTFARAPQISHPVNTNIVIWYYIPRHIFSPGAIDGNISGTTAIE